MARAGLLGCAGLTLTGSPWQAEALPGSADTAAEEGPEAAMAALGTAEQPALCAEAFEEVEEPATAVADGQDACGWAYEADLKGGQAGFAAGAVAAAAAAGVVAACKAALWEAQMSEPDMTCAESGSMLCTEAGMLCNEEVHFGGEAGEA